MPIPKEKSFSGDRPVLAAKSLVKRFGGVAAVDDVTIDVGRGEIVGLIGPNGAGKTTLLNVLSGVVKPTGGKVSFAGHDLLRTQ